MQPSITGAFDRSGYHSEFVTTVPMQFISMDDYARSPLLGFGFAGGQLEIGRFRDSPRFGFRSPADHVLYEELLAHLDGRRREDPPVFLAAITASSHPPYVDPLGKANTEEQVWGYVQEELWWFYGELKRRGFFDNGILIITGDHRRMTPDSEAERQRLRRECKGPHSAHDHRHRRAEGRRGRSILPAGRSPPHARRATHPEAALSPFVLWVERYVFVYGVASNASHLQVFVPDDGGREAFRLNLLGPWIEWLSRPRLARDIERAIHRQRALQQVSRVAALTPARVTVGRPLSPGDQQGILVGHSSDMNISRDPDDPGDGLKTFPARSLDLEELVRQAGAAAEPFTLSIRAFLTVPVDGEYWFSLFADDEGCLSIDGETVLECHGGINEGSVLLTTGTAPFRPPLRLPAGASIVESEMAAARREGLCAPCRRIFSGCRAPDCEGLAFDNATAAALHHRRGRWRGRARRVSMR